MGNPWNGCTPKGFLIALPESQMLKWFSRHQQLAAQWACKKTFAIDEVDDPQLRGARFVTLAPGETTYQEAAERAGWPDMAEIFKKEGI